jgi:hypothetical protein
MIDSSTADVCKDFSAIVIISWLSVVPVLGNIWGLGILLQSNLYPLLAKNTRASLNKRLSS